MRERILESTRHAFFQLGFHRVTMDEIARDLGISKKTLYAHFSSKEEIVREVMLRLTEEVESGIRSILDNRSGDFAGKLRQVWTFLASRISTISPRFLQDLQRYAPQLWKEVDARRGRIMREHFGKLFRKGVQQRIFRRDISPQLLTLMYATLIQRIVNPETLSQLPLSAAQAFEGIIKVMFEGILTSEARSRFGGRVLPSRNREKRI